MRLCTWSRSKRATPQRRSDSRICSGPLLPEEIQTLSAEKSAFGRPSLPRPYPMTSCEEPYMGEESIILPPSAKNVRMTSAQASRAATSSPTLKVIQLPRPTSGRCAPLEGIARVTIGPGRVDGDAGPGYAPARRGRTAAAAPAAASEARKARRESMSPGRIRVFSVAFSSNAKAEGSIPSRRFFPTA